MPSHSTILAWKIPWAEEPGGRVMWSKGLDAAERTHMHTVRKLKFREITSPPEVGVLG